MAKRRIHKWTIISLFYVGCASLSCTPGHLAANKRYDSISIELLSAPGYQVTKPDLDFLVKKLRQHFSDNIKIEQRELKNFKPLSANEFWNREKLKALERLERKIIDDYPKDRDLKLLILAVPGPFKDEKLERLAGVKYSSTSFAIFLDRCREDLVSSVLLHEFGHIAGLVNSEELKRRKQEPVNPDRPDHCNNPECVMHWTITVREAGFDSDCLRAILSL